MSYTHLTAHDRFPRQHTRAGVHAAEMSSFDEQDACAQPRRSDGRANPCRPSAANHQVVIRVAFSHVCYRGHPVYAERTIVARPRWIPMVRTFRRPIVDRSGSPD